ncbi:MAG: efflux RND transporter periplasmic adaptor subunit [Anaerolineae bacterium]|jgi:multidrug resistance efflux pump
MKRRWIVIVVVAVVALVAAGWWWVRTSPEQAIDFLVSGGLQASRAEQFVAVLAGDREPTQEPALVASGSIEGTEVSIVSEFGGRILGLYAGEGDEVEAGQVLVELDASLLKAQMGEATAAVSAAEANLANVEAGSHPAEILGAEAQLTQAQAQRDAARQVWQDAKTLVANPQELDAQIVEAQAKVDLAEVQIEQAMANIAAAEVERDRYKAQGSMEEKYLYRAYDYQVQAAQAALEAARVDKEGAQQVLRAIKALRNNPLALKSQVNEAEAQYEIAEMGVEVARTNLAEVEAGPTPEEVKVAQAQVEQARAAVAALETQLDKMTLRAPIDGLVSSRPAQAGEAAVAGATLMTVANLDDVKLTIYVPEDELGRVYLGQEIGVTVDSFPTRVFTGTVSYISQQAEFTPKNVQTEEERVNMVFAVKVRLPNPEHRLKPGMPADAHISP